MLLSCSKLLVFLFVNGQNYVQMFFDLFAMKTHKVLIIGFAVCSGVNWDFKCFEMCESYYEFLKAKIERSFYSNIKKLLFSTFLRKVFNVFSNSVIVFKSFECPHIRFAKLSIPWRNIIKKLSVSVTKTSRHKLAAMCNICHTLSKTIFVKLLTVGIFLSLAAIFMLILFAFKSQLYFFFSLFSFQKKSKQSINSNALNCKIFFWCCDFNTSINVS